MNAYVKELVQRIDNRYAVDTKDMSLGDWICQNTHLRGRAFSFDRYPFQKQIADDLHPNMDVAKPSQIGLALALDTPIPTPTGWTQIGDLKIGDQVYDETGTPTLVQYVSPVFQDRDCYEVEFDTGEVIVADANHRWYVEGHLAFNEKGLYGKTGSPPKGTSRKGIIKTSLLAEIATKGQRNLFAIPNTQPLLGHQEQLPVDPYFLGVWLGDGNNAAACITSHKDDAPHLTTLLEARGMSVRVANLVGDTYQLAVCIPRNKNICPRGHDKEQVGRIGPWGTCAKCAVQNRGKEPRDPSVPYDTMYRRLSLLKLISQPKFIPDVYLRASVQDRLELLRGLLDTDGSITKLGRVSFYNTSPELVRGVEELAHSLGFKPRTRWRKPATATTLVHGKTIQGKKLIADVSFAAYIENPVFNLPRKRERLNSVTNSRPQEALRRRIVRVELTQSVPTRCISVTSPRSLFLAGRGMIPTHNTEVQIRKSLGFLARNRGTAAIFTLPTDPMFERMSSTRILPLVKEEKVFNLDRDSDKPTRSKGLIQIGNSFLYVTGAKEGDATSISADMVMNDEIDLTDQKMLALFSSRLQNSDWKISQRFSTPTFVNFGIDAGFMGSDQHIYMQKCDACNHWQEPIFTRAFIHLPGLADSAKLEEIDTQMLDRLRLEEAYVCCEKCRAPLDLGRTENREWVAKFASRTHHRGYRVSPFSTDRLSVQYIISQLLDYKRLDYLRGWYNTVLGMAHDAGNARLSDADIELCFTNEMAVPTVDPRAPTWLGIDVGQTCHIIVSQGVGAEDQQTVMFKSVSVDNIHTEVQTILDTYNVIGGACDRHPYTPTADALFLQSQKRILPIEYRGEKELNFVLDPVTKEVKHAQANRTILLDLVAKVVRTHRVRFRGYGLQKSLIQTQLKDMVRDETPEKPATWVKLTGNDHYFHALGFLFTGIKLRETYLKLFSDARTKVAVAAVQMDMSGVNINRHKG